MEIYIVDLETTGLDGYPVDKIFEIAICKVDIEALDFKPVYNEIIRYNATELTEKQKTCWIIENGHINLEDIYKAEKDISIIADEVKKMLFNKKVTSWNRDYDFGKFLSYKPFELTRKHCIFVPCVMKSAIDICKITNQYGYKFPKLDEACEIILKEQMTGAHRALTDTIFTCRILIEMIKKNLYPIQRGNVNLQQLK